MKKISLTLFALVTTLVGACKPLELSLNNKVIYTPTGLFTQFQVADRNLRNCLDQTIIDLKATSADQVKTLNCSNAGIESLDGIEIFSAIEALNLAENKLRDISPLRYLPRLQHLLLRDNDIQQADSLLNLLHLLALDVSGNVKFDCALRSQLTNNLAPQKPQLIWPEHCQ